MKGPGVAAVALAMAIPVGVAATTTPTSTAAAATHQTVRKSSPVLTVGTWNLSSISGTPSGNHMPWRERERVIVRQIVRSHLDVLGVQEVSASLKYKRRLVHGNTQFRDLRNSLNRTGLVRYALTSTRLRGSLNNRILYKPHKLRLLRQGAVNYDARVWVGWPGHNHHPLLPRGMDWAVFQVKATGARFLFVNTHLQHRNTGVQSLQWHQQLRLIKRLQLHHPHRPAVIVGDYNQASCFGPELNRAFKRAGYPSVVDGEACDELRPIRAETYHNIWLGSFNDYRRSLYYERNCRAKDPADIPTSDDDPMPCMGRSIDRIDASRRLRVLRYEVVADMNDDKSQLVGVIPSDHYLLKATLTMPR